MDSQLAYSLDTCIPSASQLTVRDKKCDPDGRPDARPFDPSQIMRPRNTDAVQDIRPEPAHSLSMEQILTGWL